MPIYEYKCEKCEHSFEKLVFSSDSEQVACPKCGDKQVKRLLSHTNFIGNSSTGSCASNASKDFS